MESIWLNLIILKVPSAIFASVLKGIFYIDNRIFYKPGIRRKVKILYQKHTESYSIFLLLFAYITLAPGGFSHFQGHISCCSKARALVQDHLVLLQKVAKYRPHKSGPEIWSSVSIIPQHVTSVVTNTPQVLWVQGSSQTTWFPFSLSCACLLLGFCPPSPLPHLLFSLKLCLSLFSPVYICFCLIYCYSLYTYLSRGSCFHSSMKHQRVLFGCHF